MTILDSNIIIYSALSEHVGLRKLITERSPYVSDISRLEVLGFSKLLEDEILYFESFFASTTVIQISNEVVTEAINLRQRKKMTVGDSIIAATALLNDFELITNNIKDFRWIRELRILNPFQEKE
jgi:predicted nucleic acid-binding protein